MERPDQRESPEPSMAHDHDEPRACVRPSLRSRRPFGDAAGEPGPGAPLVGATGVKGEHIVDGERDPDTIAEEQRIRSAEYEAHGFDLSRDRRKPTRARLRRRCSISQRTRTITTRRRSNPMGVKILGVDTPLGSQAEVPFENDVELPSPIRPRRLLQTQWRSLHCRPRGGRAGDISFHGSKGRLRKSIDRPDWNCFRQGWRQPRADSIHSAFLTRYLCHRLRAARLRAQEQWRHRRRRDDASDAAR